MEEVEQDFAIPLQDQRLKRALRLEPFLDQVERVFNQPLSDSDEDSDSQIYEDYLKNGFSGSKEDEREDRAFMYNFTGLKEKRLWLKDVLLSSSESDSDAELGEQDLLEMLKEHKLRKKYQAQFYQKQENSNYMYYSAGVLSRVDKYSDHQKFLTGNKRKKGKEQKLKERREDKAVEMKQQKTKHASMSEGLDGSSLVGENGKEEVVTSKPKSLKSIKKNKKPKKLDMQALAIRRHKLWVLMAKKEVGKCQKSRVSFRKEVLQNCKKMATACMRHCRQRALQSQKLVKDKVWLLKRLTRTMLNEWKKFDRILKEQNRRAEKEAEEQRRINKEIMEAKRQQRKLNFLITLPELYAHFMKKKMNSSVEDDEGTVSILKQLEDDHPLPTCLMDDYDCETLKERALQTAKDAFSTQMLCVNNFGNLTGKGRSNKLSLPKENKQPTSFNGELKSYQLKGMNWLANLYYFGINGILADEMGLGKTVQCVAFLAHICEKYDTWGPFLIITPASTLHNWTCEIAKFVPCFKVVPYWGNPEERKNLRKFFDGKHLGTREASFYLVVTSYQIVIQDFKFLNRLKWNYMVLDEAQAIKSINSQRWKQLLGFSCRNRLLLSGTPIQNSMVELWALLHFIMPTLFDSHSWFNEWFSKDIEGHVENRTAVDEKHLNRLHMILKPFMLRRVKAEVENELSDKIEIMMYCPLTLRQTFLYGALKNKISIDELLRSSMSSQITPVTTSLMNLIMQFRKVCNHPELLEKREVKSPFILNPDPLVLPKLIYREGLLESSLPSRKHILYNRFSIFHPQYIYSTLKEENERSCFSFLKFVDLNIGEVSQVALEGILIRWILYLKCLKRALIRRLKKEMHSPEVHNRDAFHLDKDLPLSATSDTFSHLVFTLFNSSIYTFTDHIIHSVPESLSHRFLRSQKLKRKVKIEEVSASEDECKDSSQTVGHPSPSKTTPIQMTGIAYSRSQRKSTSKYAIKKPPVLETVEEVLPMKDCFLVPEFPHVKRPPFVRRVQPTSLPTFLLHTCSKSTSTERRLYSSDRSFIYWQECHSICSSSQGLATILYGSPEHQLEWKVRNQRIHSVDVGGLYSVAPKLGWNHIIIPDKHTLIMDAGKLYVLDTLLRRLKEGNHRVLIYSQMTKMIDLLEDYMWHRKHKYMRLDGSSKISDRRDMVDDFQTKSDIFVFLLSTRAGGVGINLTAADTVIFYDSDWNPTVDQQAMDRAHRLGQTKQVTVYRLICKSTIEERILQRAKEKSEIQRMVISGGNLKPDSLKPIEVVSLLLDDDIEKEYRAKQRERRTVEDNKIEINREKMRERMRKRYAEKKLEKEWSGKKRRLEGSNVIDVCGGATPSNSSPGSPAPSEGSSQSRVESAEGGAVGGEEESLNDSINVLDVDSSSEGLALGVPVTPSVVRHRRRGRPRGSVNRGRGGRSGAPAGPISKTDGGRFDTGPKRIASARRGRGRPRLMPLGPGHQGSRRSPSLPVALGSSLGMGLKRNPRDDKRSKTPFR